MKRLIAIAIVLCAGVVSASLSGSVAITPGVSWTQRPLNTAGSASAVTVTNTGTTSIASPHITPGACSNGVSWQMVNGATFPDPFLMGSSFQAQATCTGTSIGGMR